MSAGDQYTAAADAAPSLTEKLTDVHNLIKKKGTVMLVTRAPTGDIHSRCMAPAEITPDWKFRFIYDKESYKNKEVDNE